MKKKISVIIRSHNSAKFINKAIKSALKQTLSKKMYEIVVVDDGSTDNTRKILKSYGKKIRLFLRKKSGPIKAVNFGIKQSEGEYIVLLDADDTFKPTILKEMLEVIKEVDFVYCDYYEKRGNKIKTVSLKNIFNSVAGGILYKKSIVLEAGGYDESLFFPEYDLLIKLMKKHQGKHIPRPLFTYHRLPKSLTSSKKRVEKGQRQLFKKYGKIEGLKLYD